MLTTTRMLVSTSSAAVLALALAGNALAAEGDAGKQQQALADVTNAIKISKLDGMRVNGPDGNAIGEISEAFLDPASGQINYVVLSKGGALGIGGDDYLVPWDSVRIDRAQDVASVNVPEERWESEFSAYEEIEEQREEAQERREERREDAQERREEAQERREDARERGQDLPSGTVVR